MKKSFGFLQFLILIALCILVAFVFVWLLWKWAVSAPRIYTAAVLIAGAGLLIFAIVKRIALRHRKS